MKILHVAPAYHPFQEKGGPVFKVRALATTLARHGHHVTVLTPDLGLHNYKELRDKASIHNGGWKLELDGVTVVYLKTVAHYRALTINTGTLGFCKRFLPVFDIVHCYGLYDLLGPTLGLCCRRRRIPYMIEPMGMYRPIDRNLQLKRAWHHALGRPFLSGAEKIVATSELEEQELLDAGFSSSKVILRYNGIDANLFVDLPSRGTFREKWGLPRNGPLVLFISRLIPRKGADVLIRAFAKACEHSGHLVIAGPDGEDGYSDYLKSIANNSGVRERITFCGPIYGQEKKEAIMDADIFVLPSRYENFANVVAEAIACGVPVIVSEACGIHSLVEGKAGLVIRPCEEDLREALRTMILDQALYSNFKKGCERVSVQLDWDKLTQEMEIHYRSTLGEKTGL